MGVAFGAVTLLYVGLAVATIGLTVGTDSKVPLADLIAVGFGQVGRDATAVLAVALTMGTMNMYLAGAACEWTFEDRGPSDPRPISSGAQARLTG